MIFLALSYLLLFGKSGAYSPFDLHYDNGVNAYAAEDWETAVVELERAIRERDTWIESRVHCAADACAKVPEDNHKGSCFWTDYRM